MVKVMAIGKPNNANLLDDLVLNFDPFVVNGLQELNAADVQDSSGDHTSAAPGTGAILQASDADAQEAPAVTLFRSELSAGANAESSESASTAHGISVSAQNPFGLPGDSSVSEGAAVLAAHQASLTTGTSVSPQNPSGLPGDSSVSEGAAALAAHQASLTTGISVSPQNPSGLPGDSSVTVAAEPQQVVLGQAESTDWHLSL
jgi:hypothetical protein